MLHEINKLNVFNISIMTFYKKQYMISTTKNFIGERDKEVVRETREVSNVKKKPDQKKPNKQNQTKKKIKLKEKRHFGGIFKILVSLHKPIS